MLVFRSTKRTQVVDMAILWLMLYAGLLLLVTGCAPSEPTTRRHVSHLSTDGDRPSSKVGRSAPDAISISDLSDEVEVWLSKRLQHYLAEMTGRQVPVIMGRQLPPDHGNVFVLDLAGNHRAALAAGSPRLDLPPNREAFFVKSYKDEGRQVVVISGRGLPGLGYGVFDYLQRYCRVGFFADGVHVPKMNTVPMSGLDFVGVPRFEIRSGIFGNFDIDRIKELGDHLQDVKADFWLARKVNEQISGPMVTKILGGSKIQWVPPIEVFPAMSNHIDIYPKGIMSDGFSTWRGPKWYGEHTLVIDTEHDAKHIGRVRAPDQNPVSKQSSFDRYTVYYMGAGHLSESGEFAVESDLQAKWSAELSRERIPNARGFIITYGPARFEEMARLPVPAFVQNLDNAAAHYVPAPWRGESAMYRFWDYFAGQPFLIGLTAGQISPCYRPFISHMRRSGDDPKMANCIGVHMHTDARTLWQRQDLMTALGWNPEAVTFEGWCRDVAERRFGVASAGNMAESFRWMTLGQEYSQWMVGIDRYCDGRAAFISDFWRIWPLGVSVDWFAATNGNKQLRFFREAIRHALQEAVKQNGNGLYNNYLSELYTEFVNRACNLEMIRLHSTYFKGMQAIRAGNSMNADQCANEFHRRGKNLKAMMLGLADVYGTTREGSWVTPDGRMVGPKPGKERRAVHFNIQNSNHYRVREFIARLLWPRVQVMIDFLHNRLVHGDTSEFPQRGRDIWPSGAPTPELGFYFYASDVPGLREKEREIFDRYLEDDFDDLPRFKGTTVEAVRAGIKQMIEMDCLYFEDMTTPDEISGNYPLSDPVWHGNTTEPVKLVNDGNGPWRAAHYKVEPYFRGVQSVYSGAHLGRFVPFDDDGQLTLTFSYRNASTMRNDGEVSYILVGFQVQDQLVAGLRFYNDGEKRPRVEVNPIDLVRYELDTPAWASPWLAKEMLHRKDVIRSGEAASDEINMVTMRYDAHSRKVTIDGDEVGHVEGEARYNKLRRGSLYIQTFYPMTGEPAKINLKGIKINGQAVELYTGDFMAADEGPMAVEIPAEVGEPLLLD